jgi:hypothetical protein
MDADATEMKYNTAGMIRGHHFHKPDAQSIGHDVRRGPMMGGIICPPVEAAASTAPANWIHTRSFS